MRVIRACRDMGLASVAVYSDCDRTARHVRMADEAVAIGPNPASQSYLRVEALLAAARASGADAVHPGYGFLSENADFAQACADAGLTFIGPTPSAIRLLGSKTAARRVAREADVPVVPGTVDPLPVDARPDVVAQAAKEVGFPLFIKAVAGGGGKGMRVVTRLEDVAGAVSTARSEALNAFGDGSVYFERYIARPRHVEVQLLGDQHGTVLACVERECSIQRRHQKVIEESPSLAVSPALRQAMASAAVAVAVNAGYTNVGTVEFLLDEDGQFYFLEMNTRLQVEHAVTELVTGIDLVEWQIRIARGERLTLDPEALRTPRGHAVECRIYAEDASQGFLPSPGHITGLWAPEGPGVRVDSGAEVGGEVTVFYDPMVAKLCTWGVDRAQAVARMSRALDEYEVRGIETGIPFLRWLVREPDFRAGAFHTNFLDALLQQPDRPSFAGVTPSLEEVGALAVALRASIGPDPVPVTPTRHVGSPAPRVPSHWRAQARREGLRG